MRMPEKTSPFADLIWNWMWSQRPPLNPHRFAALIGVGRQTVYNWLNRGTTPQLQFLPLIHEKTGIPLRTLYEAAGYPLAADGKLTPSVWAFIVAGVERAPDLDATTKARVVQHIGELREQYESREDAAADNETCRA